MNGITDYCNAGRSGFRIALLLGLVLVSQCAQAGRVLDRIRDYDLNNYALGMGISAEQNPFTGAENSQFAYPYLTSFEHSSMTDDWVLIRDGELGFRWVTDNNWELGAIGRIQTLGLGDLKTDELLGISEREWALELGPTIGYRGWPVHINWTSYFEPTDRHDGTISQLAFLLPMEWPRGYLVPSLEVMYESDDYTDYYYGVTPAEATPTRPAYQPGASTSTAVKVRWGYALSDKWLLTGKLGLKKSGSEITDSPIVDRDSTWSGGIALAYNANVFRQREYDGSAPRTPQWDLRIGGFRDNLDTKIIRDTVDGIPGSEVDIEDVLGAVDAKTVLQIDATLRIAHYHRLEFGYFSLGRRATPILADDLEFGDITLPAGTELNTRIDTGVFRAGYAYSLLRNAQMELGVMAGVHFISVDADITSDVQGQRARSSTSTPLPVVGLHAAVFLGPKTTLGAKLQFFRTDFDNFEGSLNYATLDIQHRLRENFSIGLGYNYYGMDLRSRDKSVNGSIDVQHQGLVAFFSLGY